jgi:hypothetical protein
VFAVIFLRLAFPGSDVPVCTPGELKKPAQVSKIGALSEV